MLGILMVKTVSFEVLHCKIAKKILKFLYRKTDMNSPKTATNLGITTHIQSMLFVPLLC